MTDSTLAPARNRKATVALVLASVSLVLSAVTCGVVASTADIDLLPVQSVPELATANQVEGVAHVTMPPGTMFLAGVYSNGLETRLSAVFRIPRDGLDAFVDSGHFTASLTPGLRTITAAHNLGGGNLWRPEAAQSVSGLDETQPTEDGTYRTVMLVLDEPETTTVFLYARRG